MASAPAHVDTQFVIGDCIDGLQRHLRSRLACEHDVQDLAQEACLKLLQAFQKGNDIDNPKAYLRTIAQHLLYHHYTNRGKWTIAGEIDIDALRAGDPGLDDWADDAQRAERLNKALRELSPKCQRALLLRWRRGLKVAEIAEAMNLSRGMVKKYLAQGLVHFRKRLAR